MLAVRNNIDPYVRIAELEEQVAYYKGELGLVAATDLVSKIGRRWNLTPHEAALVGALVAAKGRSCSKTHLIDALYAGRDEPELKIIDVFVCKVRRKIGGGLIDTLWGKGYSATADLIGQVEALKGETLPGVTPVPRCPPRSRTAWIVLKRLQGGTAGEQELFSLAGGTLSTFAASLRSLERDGLVARIEGKITTTIAGAELAGSAAA